MSEENKKFNYEKVKEATKMLLEGIGEDVNRDGLLETPDRVARLYRDVLGGYDDNPSNYLKSFEVDNKDMVIVKDIPFYSFCEHHLCLFSGKMHIAYLPDEKITGLSKLVRMARVFCKRPQVQERLTKQIADALVKNLSSNCAVYLEAEHTCMSMRGVRTPGTTTVTCAVRGIFKDNLATKQEFLAAIGK